ncbi:MAG: energy-coupling factor ABC transporter permease [Candidatus Zixiibacteriota bacterium]|jgi:ABC-type Co2+ transport system permease subunit
MYIPANAVPAWLGALGWAAAVVSVGAAVWRLRRDPPAPAGVVAAAAFVAAIRLLEFPIGEGAGGASVLAVGFAVVVFGPEVALLAMAAATLAAGVVTAPFDGAALGANLLVYAAVLPWVLGWGYGALRKAATSAAAGYVLAFVAGVAGAPLAALAVGVVAGAGGALGGAAAVGLLRAGLALSAAEGVLAAWGYALAGGSRYGAEGPAVAGVPRSGAVALGVLAVVVAAGVAPLVPAYGGPLGPMPALARAACLSYGGKVAAGLAVCGLAALAAALPWSVARLSRRRVPK